MWVKLEIWGHTEMCSHLNILMRGQDGKVILDALHHVGLSSPVYVGKGSLWKLEHLDSPDLSTVTLRVEADRSTISRLGTDIGDWLGLYVHATELVPGMVRRVNPSAVWEEYLSKQRIQLELKFDYNEPVYLSEIALTSHGIRITLVPKVQRVLNSNTLHVYCFDEEKSDCFNLLQDAMMFNSISGIVYETVHTADGAEAWGCVISDCRLIDTVRGEEIPLAKGE